MSCVFTIFAGLSSNLHHWVWQCGMYQPGTEVVCLRSPVDTATLYTSYMWNMWSLFITRVTYGYPRSGISTQLQSFISASWSSCLSTQQLINTMGSQCCTCTARVYTKGTSLWNFWHCKGRTGLGSGQSPHTCTPTLPSVRRSIMTGNGNICHICCLVSNCHVNVMFIIIFSPCT